MAENEIPSIWGDFVSNERERQPIMFAGKLMQGNAKISASDLAAKAAKFETIDTIDHKDIILYFHQKFKKENCVQQLMPLTALPGRRKWNIIFQSHPWL